MILNRKIILVILLINNFILLTLIPINYNIDKRIVNKSNLTQDNLFTSKNFDKIFLNGTKDWIEFRKAGFCSGLGTYSDPYIIEDLIINAEGNESCIWIENSDVYFRIENCTVYNSGNDSYSADAGIKLYNVSNGCLRQNIIYDNNIGIYLTGVNNSISYNLISTNNGGIASIGDNITISYNSIYNNIHGMYAHGNSRICKNNITNNEIGIFGKDFLNISSNNLCYNDLFGIYLYWGWNSSINNNIINNNNGTAILLETCAYIEISDNECNNNKFNGIHLKQDYYSKILRNNCSNNNLNGIHLQGIYDPILEFYYACYNNEISKNVVNNNFIGILLNNSYSAVVFDNIINNNQDSGIKLNSTVASDITRNQVNDNHYGIKLIKSDGIDIEQNIINYNIYGIYLISSRANDIIGNTLHYNRICYLETGDCVGNDYIDNDCIELKDDFLNWTIILGVISLTSGVGIVILLLRRKRT